MSSLQVANLHFESTANNRIQYDGSNGVIITAGGTSIATVNSSTIAVSNGLSVANALSIGGNIVNPFGSGMKNRIINGDMRIDQRNAGASVTAAGAYTIDRWYASSTASSKYTVQRNAGSVTPPAGFSHYLGVTSSSSYIAGASETFNVNQGIEGYHVADLAFGTASAKSFTLSFWVYSSITGTFSGNIGNNDQTRSYPFTYSISSANTWTYATVVVPGDTTGTWTTDNSQGLVVHFDLGSGSNFRGTANTWASANYKGATGSASIVGTSGAKWYVTGVQLEIGTSATPFERRFYGTELSLCHRYYEVGDSTFYYNNISFGIVYFQVLLKATKRASPTVTRTGNGSVTSSTSGTTVDAGLIFTDSFYFGKTSGTTAIGGSWKAESEL